MADILEIDLPGGDVLELDIEEGASDEDITTAIKEATTTPFDPADISFGELPEGDTGTSPVDIKGQPTLIQDGDVNEIVAAFAPTSSRLKPPEDIGLELTPGEEGELSTLEVTGETDFQQSLNAGLAFVSDVFSLPERVLGAFAEKAKQKAGVSDSDATILQELGDPNSSLFKETKQKLRDSGAPGVLKFLGEAGLSIISDPLFIGAVGKTGVKTGVALAKGARKPIAPPPPTAKLSKEIQEQVEILAPKKAKIPDTIEEIDLTPGEKQLLGGIEDEGVLAAEAVARAKAPGAVEKIKAIREGVGKKKGLFQTRLEQKIEDTGIKDLARGSETLTKKVRDNFDSAFKEFEKQTSKAFDEIEAAGNSAPINPKMLDDAKESVRQLLPGAQKTAPKFRNATELSDSEIATLVREKRFNATSLFDDAGQPVTKEQVKIATGPTKISRADLKVSGISKETKDEIDDFIEIMGKPDLTYTKLKDARGTLFETESLLKRRGMRNADKFTINNLRQHYKNLMGKHLEATDQAAFESWKKIDPFFAKESKEGFKTLRNNFYKPDGKLKKPQEAFDSVISSKNAGEKLAALKERLPPPAYEQLQNAYFNRIIEGSFKNGIVDEKLFLKSIDKFGGDTALWDFVLTQKSKDVLADLITDAVVLNKVAKFKTPKAIETAIGSLMKGLGGQAVRWGIWYNFGGPKAAAFTLSQKLLNKGVVKTEARQAVDFFKGVDSPSFLKSFKEGLRSSRIDEQPIRFLELEALTPAKRGAAGALIEEEELTQ